MFSCSMHLDQHRVAIVCSARSGSTKALGTTNLLLRAAGEALKRPSGALGTLMPLASPPSVDSPRTWSFPCAIDSSSPPTYPQNLTPPSSLDQKDNDTPLSEAFPFYTTINILQNEHVAAAQETIRDTILLEELKEEIEEDCDALRRFLFATRVEIFPFLHLNSKFADT